MRLESAPNWTTALVVLTLLLPIYLATNTADLHQNRDGIASALPAWSIANRATVDLSGYEDPWLTWRAGGAVRQIWYVDTGERVVSNRPPGAIFWAVPFYWISPDSAEPTMVPAAVAASVAAATAMALLHMALRHLTTARMALAGALIAGLATPIWSVSSDALWQHGPSQMWLALSLVTAGAGNVYGTGTALALAVFTRPLTAVIAAATGILASVRRRTIKPVLVIGVISGLGAASLIAYNAIMFTTPSPTGGYGSYPVENIVGYTVGQYAHNLVGTLVSHTHGILIYSPFLVMLLPGLRAAWRAAPGWVRTAALAGLAYMLVQLRVNYFTGGDAFYGYRLPLEMLTMAAPLLFLSYQEWVRRDRGRKLLFALAVLAALVMQIYGSIFFPIPEAI